MKQNLMDEIMTEIRTRYGDYLTSADVGRAISLTDRKSYSAWIAENNLPTFLRNGRKRYRAADVARAIYGELI